MFSSIKQRVIIIGFILLLVSIPAGSLLLSQRLKVSSPLSKNFDRTITTTPSPVPRTLPIQTSQPSPSSTPLSTPAAADAVSLGPTLKFSVSLQGRDVNNQSGKFFVGIAQGTVTKNPTYLLTFTINMPETGVYSTLSLVGLNIGSQYTAYIKGPAQLVAASTFILSPTGATLNAGQPLGLISGDLNEDNVIDASDLAIVTKLAGATSDSPTWNPLADINLDNIINSIDIQIVKTNQGKIGDGGAWYSRPPEASSSASLPSNIGGLPLSQPDLSLPSDLIPKLPSRGGYWIFVPSN